MNVKMYFELQNQTLTANLKPFHINKGYQVAYYTEAYIK
jgi:hypothetical protein